MIKVLVADDQELIREGLVLILSAQPDIDVVGEASDGANAVSVAAATRPDVVVMDVRMPRMDGIEATIRILDKNPQCRILVLTTFDVDAHVLAVLRAGASGFLLKDTPRRSLLAAVRAVAEGDVLLDHDVTQRLVTQHVRLGPLPPAQRLVDRLTDREMQVLRTVSSGRTNAEAARDLGISETTVKTHIAHLLDKLEVRDRVQLVVFAHTNGLTTAP